MAFFGFLVLLLRLFGSKVTESADVLGGGCFGFDQSATATLDHITGLNCTIANADPTSAAWTAKGGAIWSRDATVTITNSYFGGSRAAAGGSIFSLASSVLSLNNVTFYDSRCTARGCIGGAIVPEGNTQMTIANSLFSGCVAPDGFGGAIDDGTRAIWSAVNTTFYNNRATYGGAVYNFGSAIASFKNCSFLYNVADNNGGALKPTSDTIVTVEDSLFEGNSAASNAAVGPQSECTAAAYCVTILRTRFVRNYAASLAGAVALVASVRLEDVIFDGNSCADTAGALYAYLELPHILKNLTFINNYAPNGAAIYIEGSMDFIFNGTTTFRNNSARYLTIAEPTGLGGAFAIVRSASANFYGPVIFEKNSAGIGGAIYAGGASSVFFADEVSFMNNTASTNGAGLWLGASATVNLTTNVTFSHNAAVSYGGAIYQDAQAKLNTVGIYSFGNTASYGAGFASSSTSTFCPAIRDSAFVNNTATLLGGAIYVGSSAIDCAGGEACPGCYMSGNVAPFGADQTSAPASVNATEPLPTSVSASEGFSASFKLFDNAGRQAASTDRVVTANILSWTLPDGTTSETPAAKRDSLQSTPTTPTSSSASPIILRGPNAAYFISNVASFGALKLSGPPGSTATIEFDASPPVPHPVRITMAITPCAEGYVSYESDGTYYCLKAIRTSKATQIAITTIAAVCILIGLITLIWLIVNRNRTAIRKSSTLFCILTTIGAIIMFVAAIMWVYVSDATCALRVWLLVLGFVLCYGSIFVKEYRLWLIFDETDLMRTVRVTDGLLLKVVFGGLFVELLICMIWFIITPFLKRIVVDLSSEEISYRCTSTVTPAFFWIIFALNMGILIIGCILAFLARNVPANFNEAKQILFSIYNVTLIAIIVVILSNVFSTSPEATALTVSIGLLFSSLITICILFIPKIRHVANKDAVRRAILKDIAQLERDIQWKKRMLNDVQTETSGSSTGPKGHSADSHTAR